MKKIAWIILPFWIIGFSWYYVCKIKQHCPNKAGANQVVTTPDNDGDVDLTKISDGNFSTSFPTDAIFFKENKDSLIVEGDGEKSLADLADYLTNNKRNLNITGKYSNSETFDAGKESNLGLNRAGALERYLMNMGVAKDKFSLSFLETNDLNKANGNIYFPFQLDFSDGFDSSNVTDEELSKAKSYLDSHESPMIRFQSGSSVMDLSPETNVYLQNLIYYVNNTDGSSVQCVGYTDNVGNRDSNVALGKRRAEFVAGKLKEKGLEPSKVTTSSMGPDNPIADNSTPEGRAENRRVEINYN